MIIILFRLLILIALVIIVYTAYEYVRSPLRKLERAKKIKSFYYLDDPDNVKKNLMMTYKGMVFEGEKYIGATEQSFDVVSISVQVKDPQDLQGLERNDLYFLEKELLIRYPQAEIDWKYPINELLTAIKN
ncbi:sigma-w pathway protein ysdB [Radiobacillus kanasensis]|uniref:sigma-w pathway protein ysdB n=1 Tax=Radiobacillus kanasensis TaxID=2844358 RepID=UPI001E5CBC48|nr:sigma-w pathway protein ysdB [Radiobacillus kanasensis]UFT97988.1 sigma-w pathway protein ysdB [Radiobacillus kanasensis]